MTEGEERPSMVLVTNPVGPAPALSDDPGGVHREALMVWGSMESLTSKLVMDSYSFSGGIADPVDIGTGGTGRTGSELGPAAWPLPV